jgi:acetoacetyl-CoA synthetase
MAGNDAVNASLAGQGYGETLWAPDAEGAKQTQIARYMEWLSRQGVQVGDYDELWRWSTARPGDFWESVWQYFGVLGDRGTGAALTGGPMPDVRWFPGATINYARNMLRTALTHPDRPAIIHYSERTLPAAGAQADSGTGTQSANGSGSGPGSGSGTAADSGAGTRSAGGPGSGGGAVPGARTVAEQGDGSPANARPARTSPVTLSYGELRGEVARVAAGLRELGVRRGDRVAGLLPNIPEAVIALLATASIGAIWSCCAPEFGTHSVVDRFAQIGPAVLIAVDGYQHNGKQHPRGQVVAEVARQLPGLAAVVTIGLIGAGINEDLPGRTVPWEELGDGADMSRLEFEDLPFEHPLWVLYSSGTTGLPKPIMHGHGGIVLEHLKSLAFQLDVGPGDRFAWYTSTGWMMWNFLAGGLLAGATIVTYDGAAGYPAAGRLWELAADARLSYLGVGAAYLMACQKAGLRPGDELDLSSLRGIGSTGSPLPPEGFRWVYEAVKPDVVLGSMSGGTDVCTGFLGASPLLPVRSGIIAGPSLGVKAEAFDSHGRPVTGQVGELVVTQPMPSMPVGFWNDPDGSRYRESYYGDFPGAWRHGDWIEMMPDGGCVIYGRSDATLNRGGVRMGTSEFYRVVEALPEVADSLVVDAGGRLVLFVALANGVTLDDDLVTHINSMLRAELSPRHVPDDIIAVPGVPRTLSGKKLEIPVRKILLGTPVREAADPSALANPEVLAHFALGAGAD